MKSIFKKMFKNDFFSLFWTIVVFFINRPIKVIYLLKINYFRDHKNKSDQKKFCF